MLNIVLTLLFASTWGFLCGPRDGIGPLCSRHVVQGKQGLSVSSFCFCFFFPSSSPHWINMKTVRCRQGVKPPITHSPFKLKGDKSFLFSVSFRIFQSSSSSSLLMRVSLWISWHMRITHRGVTQIWVFWVHACMYTAHEKQCSTWRPTHTENTPLITLASPPVSRKSLSCPPISDMDTSNGYFRVLCIIAIQGHMANHYDINHIYRYCHF